MAQYTSRQEYRYTDPSRSTMLDNDDQHLNGRKTESEMSRQKPGTLEQNGNSSALSKQSSLPIATALEKLYERVQRHEAVPFETIRDVLRLAASLLCRSRDDNSTVVSLFVKIPFAIFTKQSIKLGLSLWMGVIKENAHMESRLLMEIIEQWISTADSKHGIFDMHLT